MCRNEEFDSFLPTHDLNNKLKEEQNFLLVIVYEVQKWSTRKWEGYLSEI